DYVAPGSELLVVAGDEEVGAQIAREFDSLKHQAVIFQQGDTTERRTLEALPLDAVDHIIVLSYSDELDVQEADARTLVTLLHLRSIIEQRRLRPAVISEMLDVRNRELAEVARADDFIVSDRLVSLMMAQLAENVRLAPVFDDIFDPEGSELYLKPAEDYVAPGRPVNFYTVVEAAARRGEVAVGYRLRAQAADATQSYGVHLNPIKSEMITFAEGDRIIVLAEG
ncbi:MAG TPA: potassium transporter TrkA, partial [Anaerolineae bacterium]|nr:potassium transporter TrkA [Anaerolineae bacterium]